MSIRVDIKYWQENSSLSRRLKNDTTQLNEMNLCVEEALSSYHDDVLKPLTLVIETKFDITEKEAVMRLGGLIHDLLLLLNDYLFNIATRTNNNRSSKYNKAEKDSRGDNNKFFQRVTKAYQKKLGYMMFSKGREEQVKRLAHFKAERGIHEFERDDCVDSSLLLENDLQQFHNSVEGREITKRLKEIELILGTYIDTAAIPHANLTMEAEFLDKWLMRYNECSGEQLTYIPDSWFSSLSHLGFEEKFLSHYNKKSSDRIMKAITRNSEYGKLRSKV